MIDKEFLKGVVIIIKVGIDKIGMYVPINYIEMTELATHRGVDPAKWTIGIGQDQMAVPSLATDVVAMAANAAKDILSQEDKQVIDQVIVGSESGVDFSKSIASYVHHLLGIQPFAKAFEIKHACYGATAGLQSACDYVRLRPDRKVLVIATDIAKYGLNTAGEPTQGAGAIAMLVSANPSILAIEGQSYMHTNHQFDFWRPNYFDYAMVDGHFSTQLYQDEFATLIQSLDPVLAASLEAMVFHLPFTKMGKKALNALKDRDYAPEVIEKWQEDYHASTLLNRRVGNIYTGSLFLSLLSLLVHSDRIKAGDKLGLFSYGSGAVSELLIGQVQDGFQQQVDKATFVGHLDRRTSVSPDRYEAIFSQEIDLDQEGSSSPFQAQDQGFYLQQVDRHRRIYGYHQD